MFSIMENVGTSPSSIWGLSFRDKSRLISMHQVGQSMHKAKGYHFGIDLKVSFEKGNGANGFVVLMGPYLALIKLLSMHSTCQQ